MKERAKELRCSRTEAANRIWYYLRNRRLGGYKFVREQVIDHYIADFVCREKKLIIEIDGGQHLEATVYDAVRTQYLESCGFRVLRIWNDEVFNNMQGVADAILQILEALPSKHPHPQPFSLKGEGS